MIVKTKTLPQKQISFQAEVRGWQPHSFKFQELDGYGIDLYQKKIYLKLNQEKLKDST